MSATPGRGETTARISYKARANAQAPRDPGWVELASETPASHGQEFIVVGGDAGAFTQLRLTAASGRPSIRAVRVDYLDGSRRTYKVDKVLGGRQRPVYVDLRGARDVRQVIVFSDRRSRGSYIVEGNTRDAGVASR